MSAEILSELAGCDSPERVTLTRVEFVALVVAARQGAVAWRQLQAEPMSGEEAETDRLLESLLPVLDGVAERVIRGDGLVDKVVAAEAPAA